MVDGRHSRKIMLCDMVMGHCIPCYMLFGFFVAVLFLMECGCVIV